MNSFVKNIGTDRAFTKIARYCSYQERCHSEVKQELFSYGLYSEEVDEILVKLITENYLNEQRFAIAFAGGRFRLKKWGRVKIRYELRKRRISDACISNALYSLDEEAYNITLIQLFQLKEKAVSKEKNPFKRKMKIRAWLLQKGYEGELISDLFENGSQI